MLLDRGRNAEYDKATTLQYSFDHASGLTPAITSWGGGIADHAARAACIRSGDDGRKVADMHLGLHRRRDSATLIAAAILSRNDDSTKIMASSMNPPFQSSGRNFGSTAGTWLSSKWRDNNANPTSSRNKLLSITHSCARWATKPSTPGPVRNPVNRN